MYFTCQIRVRPDVVLLSPGSDGAFRVRAWGLVLTDWVSVGGRRQHWSLPPGRFPNFNLSGFEVCDVPGQSGRFVIEHGHLSGLYARWLVNPRQTLSGAGRNGPDLDVKIWIASMECLAIVTCDSPGAGSLTFTSQRGSWSSALPGYRLAVYGRAWIICGPIREVACCQTSVPEMAYLEGLTQGGVIRSEGWIVPYRASRGVANLRGDRAGSDVVHGCGHGPLAFIGWAVVRGLTLVGWTQNIRLPFMGWPLALISWG